MGRVGQALSQRHVACAVRAARRRPPDLLLIAAEDGQKIAGHRSLLCLFSPTFAALLSGHDQGEGIIKVFLEVSSIGLFAFHRIVKTGGQTAESDWSLAEDALRLLDVNISPEPEEANGLHGVKVASDSYEDFLRDSFIKHENDKGEADDRKWMLGQEVSSKVAVARALSAHAPDLVLVADDGAMVLGHRSLLALFSPVFRQLLPRHDQQEELLALSLPFARDAVFAFHRSTGPSPVQPLTRCAGYARAAAGRTRRPGAWRGRSSACWRSGWSTARRPRLSSTLSTRCSTLL
jgi:hypothetical protein